MVGTLRRFRPVLQLDQRTAADIGQIAEIGLAVARGLHELLGDELAAVMVAAMGKLAADLVEHHVHVGQSAFVKFIHDASSWSRQRPPSAAVSAVTIFSRNLERGQGFLVFRLKRTGGPEDMGAALQIANASVAVIFAVALLVTAQLFTEYRSAHGPVVTYAERLFVPL